VNPYPETASFAGPGGTSEFKQKSLGAFVELEPARNPFAEFAALNDLRDHDVYDTTQDVFRVFGEPDQTFRAGWAGSRRSCSSTRRTSCRRAPTPEISDLRSSFLRFRFPAGLRLEKTWSSVALTATKSPLPAR